jgi:proteic killer suppression protein
LWVLPVPYFSARYELETGNTSKIQAKHADKIHDVLQVLDCVTNPEQMKLPGLGFHKLSGDLKGFYAVKISGNWRIIFGFDGKDVILADYIDYH